METKLITAIKQQENNVSPILSFDKDGYLEINRETLRSTARYELAKGGLRAVAPVEHFMLLDKIEEMVYKHTGITPVQEPITIEQNQSLRLMWNGAKDQCPTQNYLIQRATTKLNINHPSDTEHNMTVGVSYSEKGIQVAFGTNVRVCSNLSVFGENVFSTWGDKAARVPFDKGMELLEKWVGNYAELRDRNGNIIKRLKEIEVAPERVEQLFGKLIRNAVMWNAGQKQYDTPFNVTQVHRMIEQGYANPTATTAWDITNWGTEVNKPRTAYSPELIQRSNQWNNYILNEFEVSLLN